MSLNSDILPKENYKEPTQQFECTEQETEINAEELKEVMAEVLNEEEQI